MFLSICQKKKQWSRKEEWNNEIQYVKNTVKRYQEKFHETIPVKTYAFKSAKNCSQIQQNDVRCSICKTKTNEQGE